jgi:pentatricopeptide repeat protein
MVFEGCTPNLVKFNTLIDLYVKTGQWQEAMGVLDTLQEHVRGLGGGWAGGRRREGSCSGGCEGVKEGE